MGARNGHLAQDEDPLVPRKAFIIRTLLSEQGVGLGQHLRDAGKAPHGAAELPLAAPYTLPVRPNSPQVLQADLSAAVLSRNLG